MIIVMIVMRMLFGYDFAWKFIHILYHALKKTYIVRRRTSKCVSLLRILGKTGYVKTMMTQLQRQLKEVDPSGLGSPVSV